MRRFILITLTALCLPTFSSSANEGIFFKAIESNKEKRALSFVEKTLERALPSAVIAAKDLNSDVIDEFIIRHDCKRSTTCSYTIIALEELNPIMIGQFDAHKILISGKKTYGIHDLVVYNDIYNDFQNQVARWNPFQFTYRLD